jgi:hypothetical protein
MVSLLAASIANRGDTVTIRPDPAEWAIITALCVGLLFVLIVLSGCAVVYCDGATGTCGATINAMTPVQLTVPISAIPSI